MFHVWSALPVDKEYVDPHRPPEKEKILDSKVEGWFADFIPKAPVFCDSHGNQHPVNLVDLDQCARFLHIPSLCCLSLMSLAVFHVRAKTPNEIRFGLGMPLLESEAVQETPKDDDDDMPELSDGMED